MFKKLTGADIFMILNKSCCFILNNLCLHLDLRVFYFYKLGKFYLVMTIRSLLNCQDLFNSHARILHFRAYLDVMSCIMARFW